VATEAIVKAAQEMDAAERRIKIARDRLAVANRKYLDYQRKHPTPQAHP